MKNIIRRTIGLLAAALVLAALTYSSVSAAEKKKSEVPKGMPTCNSMTVETACTLRDDCTWVAAAIDPKTKKQKQKAYCRTKPQAKAAPKTKT
jgi:hypothetical protein